MILIPIIYSSVKHNSNIDHSLYQSKVKTDLLKGLHNYRNQTHKQLTEQEIINLYDKLINKLSIINTF